MNGQREREREGGCEWTEREREGSREVVNGQRERERGREVVNGQVAVNRRSPSSLLGCHDISYVIMS